MRIEGPTVAVEDEAARILRSLPLWFGIEDSLVMYASDTARLPTFVARNDERVVGFLSLAEHFPRSWEIHCVAVHADARNQGYGKALLEHAENWLRGRGAYFLQVKTIAATRQDPQYAQARAFYERMGFLPLEVFAGLWSASNPCLQMLKIITEANPSMQRTFGGVT
jgi:ribosomal protein S18 acetylase RimI-like enzyme